MKKLLVTLLTLTTLITPNIAKAEVELNNQTDCYVHKNTKFFRLNVYKMSAGVVYDLTLLYGKHGKQLGDGDVPFDMNGPESYELADLYKYMLSVGVKPDEHVHIYAYFCKNCKD